jgi:polar amino acid transport system substrate-binding protein
MRIGLVLLWGTWISGSAWAAKWQFVTEPFPPFNYLANGAVAGPIPEMVLLICERLKIDCSVNLMPWRRALRTAESGGSEGIFCLSKIPEREEKFYLGSPVVRSMYVVLVNDGSHLVYNQPSDLAGYTIGVYGPSGTQRAAEEITRDIPGVRIQTEVDNDTALRMLAGGRYGEKGAVLINYDLAPILIRDGRIKNLKMVGIATKFQYYIGLSRRTVSAGDAARFDEAFQSLAKEGKVDLILKKYGLHR